MVPTVQFPISLYAFLSYRFVTYLSCDGPETFVHAVYIPAQAPVFFSTSSSLCMDFCNLAITILPQML